MLTEPAKADRDEPDAREAPATPPPSRSARFWHATGFVGRSLITLSILMVLFVVYQLWGTNLITAREQSALKSEFGDLLAEQAADEGSATASTPTTVPVLDPFVGDVLGLVEIPEIGTEAAFTEGIVPAALRRGPGHYPHTALPGHSGNAAIAGHRTTYGAPFNEIDELERGDRIFVTTLQGRFEYRVRETVTVAPGDVSVLSATPRPTLTLTTCEPELSARERLVVHATLVSQPVDAPPVVPDPGRAAANDAPEPVDSLDGAHDSGWRAIDAPMVLTAAIAAAVGGLWWWAFRKRRKITTWLAGVPPFLVALFFFYGQLESVLPSSY